MGNAGMALDVSPCLSVRATRLWHALRAVWVRPRAGECAYESVYSTPTLASARIRGCVLDPHPANRAHEGTYSMATPACSLKGQGRLHFLVRYGTMWICRKHAYGAR